ncbi:NUDIX domain-containing protein [Candidatus Southlakia epibionticum]|uniref:NUDIX domain-containing protein n=1 Tax=Candidatus Southlakia epibionticum TaxID=3043284 RepID=A0ABY8WU27_9BACT|nr:NUDIX domain-containing protein [Candidatus Saccharimonadaceae bacterium ML1]
MEYYTGRRVNVRAIIYKNGKLLAVKHKHGEDISHYYAVPGGGLDPHESLVDGLARELREETGINAVIGNLLFIQQFPSAHAGYAEELEFFFTVKNPDDFTNIDLETTSHGAEELAVCEFVDPASVTLYPEFLQSIDLVDYINNDRPALVIDNLHEIHKN